jgi:hypothetical protein
MKLGGGKKVTVGKLRDALRARSLTTSGLKRDLASRLIEHQGQQPTHGSAENSVGVPPPSLTSDTIPNEEEDSVDEE